MNSAFEYAKNQILGMTFEDFTITKLSGKYVWYNHTAALLCRFFMCIGLEFIARAIFARNLKVY